jgi:hypothetical protein
MPLLLLRIVTGERDRCGDSFPRGFFILTSRDDPFHPIRAPFFWQRFARRGRVKRSDFEPFVRHG